MARSADWRKPKDIKVVYRMESLELTPSELADTLGGGCRVSKILNQKTDGARAPYLACFR